VTGYDLRGRLHYVVLLGILWIGVLVSCVSTAAADTPLQILDFSAAALQSEGESALDTEAGGHPGALTTSFDVSPSEDIKQVVIDVPAGLVVNPQAAAKCALSDLTTFPAGRCPPASQIGTIDLRPVQHSVELGLPVYNMIPEQGYPAEFGIFETVLSRTALLYGSVRGSDYGGRVISAPFPRALPIEGVSATFFGDPALHNGGGAQPLALASNPSDCSAPNFTTSMHVDSWQHPGRFNSDGTPDFSDPNWREARLISPAVTGCEALKFRASISLTPTTMDSGAPSGLTLDLAVPQSSDPNARATPPLKDTTVTLPLGMSVSPSAADGLEGCTDAQIALSSVASGTCPERSQLGTVTIQTPLLTEPLKGQMFLGTPLCSPCTNADAEGGRMLRLFIQVAGAGIVVKLAGTTSADSSTGQLTTTFKNNPQQPFSDLKLELKAGPRAPLVTPTECGVYASAVDLTPWSTPFTADATLAPSFTVSGCPDPSLFAPSFTAGTAGTQAGMFSPFSLSIGRQDSDQRFAGLTTTLAPGLLGKLAGLPLCPDANATTGSCPPASRVGSVMAGAGPGSHPFFLPGQIYLTGPYKGGPYGLVVEVPAIAGPFNLGTVVVRQSLRVDSHTAQATVVSDAFPTMLDGVPLQIRSVSATIDRPNFTFTPTRCDPTQITGTLRSTRGQSVPVFSRFQVGGCRELSFKPLFAVSTQSTASKPNGVSLRVRVTANQGPRNAPAGPGEANIKRVDVQLPQSMPSRLTTLQKACTSVQFAADPAGCPPGSFVGKAVAHTPLLNSPLVGPAILVSHGGAAFPDLVLVLQGEGIRLDLIGATEIKKGITYSRFDTVPDAPVSSFELDLPAGPHSVLAAYLPAKANGSLCGTKLLMPTTITGQNGATFTQRTKIAVTGCPKAKKRKHASKSISKSHASRDRRRH
jgi:hypothetical protein